MVRHPNNDNNKNNQRDQADELFDALSKRFSMAECNSLFMGTDPNGRGGGPAILQGCKGDDRKAVVHFFMNSMTKCWKASAGGMVPSGYTVCHGDDLHPIPDAKTFRTYFMMLKGITWESDLAIPATTESDARSN